MPSPNSVSKPKSPVPVKLKRLAQLSPPPAFETVGPENASAAPPGPGSGCEPIRPVGLPSTSFGVGPSARWMFGRAATYAA